MTGCVAKGLIWLIERNGYVVTTFPDRIVAAASDGQSYIVTGSDAYSMACELAGILNLELEDG